MWNEFCDWYIEFAKIRLYTENEEEKIQVSYVLDEVFRTCLKLLHPFMPFITSKIYENLVHYDEKDLMVSEWPSLKEKDEYESEKETIEKIKEIIVEIRNIRNTKNIHPSKKADLIFVTTKYQEQLKELDGILLKLGFANKAKIQSDKNNIPKDSIQIVTDGIKLYIPLEGLIDSEEERKRLEEEKKKIISEIERATKMLSNPGFINKAPETKINEEKAKLAKYQEMLKSIEEIL